MSIFYKDNDSQNFSELNIGSDRISTEKLIEAIKRRENLGDLEEISLLNASTKESETLFWIYQTLLGFDEDQVIRSGSRIIFQLSDAFEYGFSSLHTSKLLFSGFDDTDILEHVMNTKNPVQETPKVCLHFNFL